MTPNTGIIYPVMDWLKSHPDHKHGLKKMNDRSLNDKLARLSYYSLCIPAVSTMLGSANRNETSTSCSLMVRPGPITSLCQYNFENGKFILLK